MGYTMISKTKNAKEALAYLDGSKGGHNGNELRNQYVSGVNLVDCGDQDMGFYYRQMRPVLEKGKARGIKNEMNRITQSFSKEELDPEKEEDILKAHEIGIETAKRLAPGYMAVVATETDGKSGLIHNHIFILNVSMENYHALHKDVTYFRNIQIVSDQVIHERVGEVERDTGMEHVNRTVRIKRDKNQKLIAEGKEPVYIWQDDLRDRIKAALSESENYEEFEAALNANGVRMEKREPKPKRNGDMPLRQPYILYELQDTSGFSDGKIPKNLRSKSYKLGSDFDRETIEETFELNRRRKMKEQEKPEEKNPEPEETLMQEEPAVPAGQDIPAEPEADKNPEPENPEPEEKGNAVHWREAVERENGFLSGLLRQKGFSQDVIAKNVNDFRRWRKNNNFDGSYGMPYRKENGSVVFLPEVSERQLAEFFEARRLRRVPDAREENLLDSLQETMKQNDDMDLGE